MREGFCHVTSAERARTTSVPGHSIVRRQTHQHERRLEPRPVRRRELPPAPRTADECQVLNRPERAGLKA